MGWRTVQGDPIDDLDQGIVVGVSDGGGSEPQGSLDLNASGTQSSGSSPHAYEIWCWNRQDLCFESAQPDNTAFDLEESNLVFTPNDAGGFDVVTGAEAETESGSDAATGGGGGGGGVAPWGLAGLLAIAGLAAARRRA